MMRVSMILVGVALLLTGSVSADNDAKSLLECESVSLLTSSVTWNSVKLATTIKNCLELTLNTDVRASLGRLKNALPTSIQHALFLDEVCIYNKKFGEYLYAPISGFLYDTGAHQTRRTFTWIPGAWAHNNKGDWKLVNVGGNKFFIVAANNGEHLSVGDVVIDKRRRVATTTPDWHYYNERLAQWILEPVGDYVYIKNKEFGEYLYAVDGLNYDSERRAVNTWSTDDNGCSGDDQCLWKILPC